METFLNQRKTEKSIMLPNSEVNLKEFFNDEELAFLFDNVQITPEETAYSGTKSPDKRPSSDSSKINSFYFDRTKFILKLVKLCKEKLNNFKENALAKGLDWLTKEIQDSILFKSDDLSMKKFEKLKKENKELQTVFSWLEEYSTIKIKQKDGFSAKVNLKEVLAEDSAENKIKKLSSNAVKKYDDNYEGSICDDEADTEEVEDMKYINFSEDTISSIEDQTFDIFKLESEVGEENILSTVSTYIFTTMGFYSMIRYDKFEAFIQAIARGYMRSNPYHNDLHAADVLQTSLVYIKKGKIKEKLLLTDIDVCALLISTIIHDFKHPGVTNLFLINTANPIAIKYNDVSVLENYHVAESFKLMKSKDEMNIFSDLTKDEYKIMRKRIVECVLATDMTFHAKQFTYLKLKIESLAIKEGKNIEKLFEGLDNTATNNTQQEFMNIIIHACDISNPTKPLHIYKRWADRVMEEFWRQGDKEKELKIPVSFLCDRNTTTLPQGQVGFMEGIVGPFVSAFLEFFPELHFLIENVNENKSTFKKIKEEEDKKKQA